MADGFDLLQQVLSSVPGSAPTTPATTASPSTGTTAPAPVTAGQPAPGDVAATTAPDGYAELQAALAKAGAAPGVALPWWHPLATSLAQGTRDAIQGVAEPAGLVSDSVGNLINLGEKGIEGLTGADLTNYRIHPLAQGIDDVLDAAGLPKGAATPGWQSRVQRALGSVVGGGVLGAAVGAAAAPESAAASVVPALLPQSGAGLTTASLAAATPSVAALYTDSAMQGASPALRSFVNAAAGLAAAGAYGGLSNLLNAPGLPDDVAAWAQRAREVYNIPVTAQDLQQNPMMKVIGNVQKELPFSGAGAQQDRITDAFNTAISRTIGENSPRVTNAVMDQARTRLGNTLDAIAQRSEVPMDDPLINALADIESNASTATGANVAPSPQFGAVQNQINDVINKAVANNGTLPGQVFQNLTMKNTPLDLVANSADPVTAYYGQQVRNALFDAWERNAPPDDVEALADARLQYKNMKTIEPLVEKSPTGALSPALLTGAARSSFDNMAYTGAGALGDLGSIGQLFLKPTAQSGTSPRLTALALLTNPALWPAALKGIAANAATGKLMRSDWMTNRLLNGPGPFAQGAFQAPTALPATVSLLQAGQPQQ